jgi:HD superfamily phosphohydrolase
MTGAKYGIYDAEWVIKSLEIDEKNDRLFVSARGLYAVEDYLQARYYMFRQVYFHRTLRAAEVVLRSAVFRALELYKSQKEIWFAKGTAFETILKGNPLSLKEHLSLDDSDLLFHIKQWQGSNDKILSDLSRRFLDRKLFKVFDLDMPEDRREEFLRGAKRIVENAGFDSSYYFIEDRTGDVPYVFYTKEASDPKKQIFVEDGFSNPVIREISEVSPAVRGLQTAYQIHRVCFPPEVKDEISKLYHGAAEEERNSSKM